MPLETPDWYRIVTDYRPRWNVGPTVPFVFGAVRKPMGEAPTSRGEAQMELHGLLMRFYNEVAPCFGTRLQPCITAGLVLAPTGANYFEWDHNTFDAPISTRCSVSSGSYTAITSALPNTQTTVIGTPSRPMNERRLKPRSKAVRQMTLCTTCCQTVEQGCL